MDSMSGKTVLITGASDGIGREVSRQLAAMGARVVMAGRNRGKVERAAEWVQRETGQQSVEIIVGDMSVQAEIRALADEFKSRFDRLDVLVNNAGLMNVLRRETVDGIEEVFAVNHLGYFLLTNLLLDLLKASAPSRIVNVSSGAHWGQRLDADNFQLKTGYNGGRAYGQSKLANLYFTYELARRLEGTGVTDVNGVTVNAVHPGWVASNLGANNMPLIGGLIKKLVNLTALSTPQGAETPVYLASSVEVEGISGGYFVRKKARRSSEVSYDREMAEKLWAESARLTGMPGQPE